MIRALAVAILSLWGGVLFAQPRPLLSGGHPVKWWFVFKFNAGIFPGCGGTATPTCRFGGTPQHYKFGQQFAVASSTNPSLKMGSGCAGDTTEDPLGATFDQVYNGSFFYAIWNDQFKGDPINDAGSPWGHSKGMLAWDDHGEGFVLQVSTPSWPGAGNAANPRMTDGNTLGCVEDDDVKVSQHFFALKLTKADLVAILGAVQNASVATRVNNLQIVKNGGPADVQQLVNGLGVHSKSTTVTVTPLSTGVRVISKPARLQVPPWQMVSALLGGIPLRVASWWNDPWIFTTTAATPMGCWSNELAKPGGVEIATSGQFAKKAFVLEGGGGPNFNHAKIGVSQDPGKHYTIFGDMNQQGDISGGKCDSSQNGRGGLFFVVDNATLFRDVTALIQGGKAGTGPSN